jgi:hypothetical protein
VLGHEAQDDQGNPDAWDKIAIASGKVKQAAPSLAQADRVMAAAPGQRVDGEGNPGAFGAKQVQHVIDANPKAFRAFAQALVVSRSRQCVTVVVSVSCEQTS